MGRKILITSALPYANGSLHVGHMLEYIQTDIYVRFLRSCGEDVVYFCADDTHGTPIEINAAKQGVKPEEFVARFFEEHLANFRDFGVQFDEYSTTNSPENKKYVELIYERLKAAGDIERRDVEQAYCEKDGRFLPDRFIRGTCPNCKAPDQYGDVCEKCGKTYSPTDLIDPRCVLCGTPPVRRKSTHLFFRLSRHADFLLKQLEQPNFVNPGVAAQLRQFFSKGLADWDISRDGPYFGFPIPGEPGKFFYVWLDAPIGYVATTEKWARRTGRAKDALDYWGSRSDARIFHVIGKDIVYFHALFWPAVLRVADFKVPERILVHGHVTLNGEKMSKSRGTMIDARHYLKHLDPSYLRFFYAANLGSGPEDLDLSGKEFRNRVNADLVNNIGNLANRLALLAGPLKGELGPPSEMPGKALVVEALKRAAAVRSAFDQLDFRSAIKGICEISQSANQFLQVHKPWESARTDPSHARIDLSDAADVVYLVAGLLQPVVPQLSEKLFQQLNAPPLTYRDIAKAKYPILDRSRKIGSPTPLIARLEEATVEAALNQPEQMVASGANATSPAVSSAQAPVAEAAGQINIEDFAKVVLKAAKVLAAEPVPKADKLLKLTVDVGEPQPRTILAGIAEAYSPEQVTGKNVVVVSNLKPRTLRGLESQGMILAAGPGGKDLSLVDPGPVAPGTVVK